MQLVSSHIILVLFLWNICLACLQLSDKCIGGIYSIMKLQKMQQKKNPHCDQKEVHTGAICYLSSLIWTYLHCLRAEENLAEECAKIKPVNS